MRHLLHADQEATAVAVSARPLIDEGRRGAVISLRRHSPSVTLYFMIANRPVDTPSGLSMR